MDYEKAKHVLQNFPTCNCQVCQDYQAFYGELEYSLGRKGVGNNE